MIYTRNSEEVEAEQFTYPPSEAFMELFGGNVLSISVDLNPDIVSTADMSGRGINTVAFVVGEGEWVVKDELDDVYRLTNENFMSKYTANISYEVVEEKSMTFDSIAGLQCDELSAVSDCYINDYTEQVMLDSIDGDMPRDISVEALSEMIGQYDGTTSYIECTCNTDCDGFDGGYSILVMMDKLPNDEEWLEILVNDATRVQFGGVSLGDLLSLSQYESASDQIIDLISRISRFKRELFSEDYIVSSLVIEQFTQHKKSALEEIKQEGLAYNERNYLRR
ncbi:MAG: hypothetical protein PF440_00405 [Thiomicrorhabdus sp.]|jgi:hypothetical protein|nr:hypothetical protein [Thiomicrorhabdus sp.]